MLTGLQAAKIACKESGWSITNLQLQKILYIAHMYYLGVYNKPLIEDELFQAWNYGPVLPKVYNKAKMYGNKPVGDVFALIENTQDIEKITFLKQAIRDLQTIPAHRLVSFTHRKNGAWEKHFDSKQWKTIPNDDILTEYKTFSRAG